MFNVGGGELLVIMLVALIVLGPQRLPGAARQVGKTLGDLRRLSTGFQNEVRSAINEADDPDRVAARRNVLAKEAPLEVMPEPDAPGTASAAPRPSAPARAAAKNGAPVRKARRAPLRAAPVPDPKSAAKPTSGTKKKATATRGGARPAPAKSGARRTRS